LFVLPLSTLCAQPPPTTFDYRDDVDGDGVADEEQASEEETGFRLRALAALLSTENEPSDEQLKTFTDWFSSAGVVRAVGLL